MTKCLNYIKPLRSTSFDEMVRGLDIYHSDHDIFAGYEPLLPYAGSFCLKCFSLGAISTTKQKPIQQKKGDRSHPLFYHLPKFDPNGLNFKH